ncbi:MAG: transaldolase [Sneathiellaceae bacterium]
MKRAVFLDRDGVLNRAFLVGGKPMPPPDLSAFEINPGVAEACARLRDAGWLLIVATNQPDVAKGTQRREVVEAMHDRLRAELPLDAIKVCWEQDGPACTCYKPKPGMLLEAARDFDIDLDASVMVGDRWRDIGAGQNAGCYTILVNHGWPEPRLKVPDALCADLLQAADIILSLTAEDWRKRKGRTAAKRGARTMPNLKDLKIKIFADGADLAGMKEMYALPHIQGFTTNPTLMKKAGIKDYKAFAKDVLAAIPDRPISFEVFADELDEMEAQGREIATWGRNVNVKIPVTNTRGIFTGPAIAKLSKAGVVLNITAVFTLDQVKAIAEALDPETPAIVSVFAGRVADTGMDPVPLMKECRALLKGRPKAELLWASPRELLNLVQADEVGCDIITMTNDLLAKIKGLGKDLDTFSLETVEMFYKDATAAGYTIEVGKAEAAE